MEFKSIEAVKKYYFPKAYATEQWNNMAPEEKGERMAMETIESIKGCMGAGFQSRAQAPHPCHKITGHF